MGRAVGVHLALSTQRPDAMYMGGVTRSSPGRGLWWKGGQEEEVQPYLVDDEDLDHATFGDTRGAQA